MRTGLCSCGCGKATGVAQRNYASRGIKKGEHYRYLPGHNNSLKGPEYKEEDRGYKTACWIWQHGRAKAGYGLIKVAGSIVTAHRAYYKRIKGPIPAGYKLDHLCRVRECVNPDHLEPVTNAENARRGSLTRLDIYRVGRMRTLFAAGVNKEELAKLFGVTPQYVGRIIAGKKWVAK